VFKGIIPVKPGRFDSDFMHLTGSKPNGRPWLMTFMPKKGRGPKRAEARNQHIFSW